MLILLIRIFIFELWLISCAVIIAHLTCECVKNGGCKERGDYAAPREGDVIAIPQALLASSIDAYGVCRCEILAFATQSIQKKKEFF